MGKVVMSREEVEEMRTESETEEKAEAESVAVERGQEENPKGIMSWERFLPKMALRVMLVEADDSTRQIIAALLRKCSYRVAAVADGLKAWEILKDKAHNIDLILTEVDLPSISGFALLTLIMEHEICKNIPVIMMSSQDSISTVYKCMMRGAADYLVKPIRRNELRNLWQHVWRRQLSINGGNAPQDESVGQQRVEMTAENNAESNHASGDMACIQRNDEPADKGSDAQSSCTKPDLQAESAHAENIQGLPLLTREKSSTIESEKHGVHANFSQKLLTHENETGGLVVGSHDNAYATNPCEGVVAERQRSNAAVASKACDAIAASSREAIDFMGTFNNKNSSSVNGPNKVDSHPGLNLSLRSNPVLLDTHVSQERSTLWHPNASAFTRYTSRPSHPADPTLTSVSNQKKEYGMNSEKNLSIVLTGNNSDTPSPTLPTPRSTISLSIGQSKHPEIAASCPQQRLFPAPVQVKGIRMSNLCAGYNSVHSPNLCPQSSVSPVLSPNSSNQQEHAFPFRVNLLDKSQQLYDRLALNANHSTNQGLQKLDRLDSYEDRGHLSPATDQSANSTLFGYGNTYASNGNVNQVAVVNASAERKEDDLLSPSGNSNRSIQREAALNKFRMKRKDRCYEKKVRYESRKKLAEQRPRVKGQFVRQVPSDPQPKEAHHQYGNSSDS